MVRSEIERLVAKDKTLPESFRVLSQALQRKKANVEWLLLVVAKLSPNHDFFKLGYSPPKASTTAFIPVGANDIDIISDENEFLKDLPFSKSKSKRAS